MNITDIIEIIGICITLILGIVSICISLKSNKISKDAISISKEANDISNSSLKLSKEIKKESDEFVHIHSSNITIKYSSDVEYLGKKCLDDLIVIIPVELRNMSTNPVALDRPSMFWGNDGEYNYLADEDFYHILNVNENDTFPIYLKPKEIRKIKIAIGFDDSDRQMFYSQRGLSFTFQGTKNQYKKYFKSSNVIDYVRTQK